MRLIDADALKELFREVIGHIAKKPEMNGNLEHMIRASAMVIQMIDDAPTVNALNCSEIPNNWVPCSERLPVPYEDVWCRSDIGQVVGYCDATGFWVGRGELELIVTAWMPLPEPYKGTER